MDATGPPTSWPAPPCAPPGGCQRLDGASRLIGQAARAPVAGEAGARSGVVAGSAPPARRAPAHSAWVGCSSWTTPGASWTGARVPHHSAGQDGLPGAWPAGGRIEHRGGHRLEQAHARARGAAEGGGPRPDRWGWPYSPAPGGRGCDPTLQLGGRAGVGGRRAGHARGRGRGYPGETRRGEWGWWRPPPRPLNQGQKLL